MTLGNGANITASRSHSGKTSIWKGFIFNIGAVILLFILSIFLGVQLNNERLIYNELLVRAQSDFDNLVLTSKWNAQYGGVFVEKLQGMQSNPYLKDPDITTIDGKVYTKKNPALMTREISELISGKPGHSFHITSLSPLNPDNKADEFETESLLKFESGTKNTFRIEKNQEVSFYRFMAPLYVQPACLQCHAHQGYQVGEVRGGISIRFDISDAEEQLRWNRYAIWALSLTVSILLLTITLSFVRKIKRQLEQSGEKIRVMATTDELTHLHNRRYFMNHCEKEFFRSQRYGHPLSCLMIDIDHFKKVNDAYGHQAGDHVLQALARLMRPLGRTSDLLARYSDKVFIMMLPETVLKEATMVAERVRLTVDRASITVNNGRKVPVTVSIGVCAYDKNRSCEMDGFHSLIKMTDEALYQAKVKGRNRVESAHGA